MIDARKHTLESVKKLTDYSDFNFIKWIYATITALIKSLTEGFLMMSRLSVQFAGGSARLSRQS